MTCLIPIMDKLKTQFDHMTFSHKTEFWISEHDRASNISNLMKYVLQGDKTRMKNVLQIFPSQINETNSKGWTALHIAAINAKSCPGMVEILVKAKASLNVKTDDYGITPLMMACKHSQSSSTEEAVEILIKSKASLDMRCNLGWTALMKACVFSQSESSERTMKMLIDAKANVNIQNGEGDTALSLFCVRRDTRKSAIKMLIDAGASVDVQDASKRTPLMRVCAKCSGPWRYRCVDAHDQTMRTIRTLIDVKASLDIRDNEGMTCLENFVQDMKHQISIHEDSDIRLAVELIDLLETTMKTRLVEKLTCSVPLPIHGGHIVLHREIAEYLNLREKDKRL